MVGGDTDQGKNVEIYSPDGGCQHLLREIPDSYLDGFYRPILAYIGGKILACGADCLGCRVKCYSYVKTGFWYDSSYYIAQPSQYGNLQRGNFHCTIM